MNRNISEAHPTSRLTDKAPTWQANFASSLEAFYSDPRPTRARFIDILWTNGILDHIAPENPEEIAKRKSRKRPVWEKGRENPHLYWRILYSIASAREVLEKQLSIGVSKDSYVGGVFTGISEAEANGLLSKIYPEKGKNRWTFVLDDLIEKAKKELEGKDQNITGHPIPSGIKGEWRGVAVTTRKYSDDGRIVLEGNSLKDHELLSQLLGKTWGAAEPWEVDPNGFH